MAKARFIVKLLSSSTVHHQNFTLLCFDIATEQRHSKKQYPVFDYLQSS